ncbi:hypothetical protein HMPREF9446_01967 [Bacteroides fluxus YIT 12057]|uniref:Uncharacterized protein n=1 Tax=Bacteroides fluxus YIT 12057 TaxID=763034 RepID=F3PT99_9BACE|nr:hypothetical protein HMPREF9446_01967 [Bacteroides fluxus YIT 12057]
MYYFLCVHIAKIIQTEGKIKRTGTFSLGMPFLLVPFSMN